MRTLILAALGCLAISPAVRADDTVTFESLLKEMVDRDAIIKFPDPAYTCKQFSSYDRASKTPDDAKAWFANGDANQYLRIEEAAAADGKKRKEWVMADMDGPGAIVRIWSANPKGNLRVYLDGADAPVIEAPMVDALGGKWKVAKPLSEECSKGWNLYLPIPYAKHCKITSDSDGFYYQVNYRTYAAPAKVESLTTNAIEAAKAAIDAAKQELVDGGWTPKMRLAPPQVVAPGKTRVVYDSSGPVAIHRFAIGLFAKDIPAALRSTVLVGEFDAEQTICVPLGDFFSQVAGISPFKDRYRNVVDATYLECAWVMPFQKRGTLRVLNLGPEEVSIAAAANPIGPYAWDSRSMHFHAAWHAEYPIHAYGGRGTKDWNYLEATGKGVYVGDSLAVMNPVADWWGEGDEKIYVDGETFPSHFGTGTEDYYGYAWCWPVVFQHPFHAQPRCDGNGKNNWGHTTVTRVRSLDAIPFTKSFKFDMEVWHWRECDEAYAATTYFYAMPGATTNRPPQPEEAAKPIPQPPSLPPPFSIAGAIECESMKILAQTPDIPIGGQDMTSFGQRRWSGESQLWVQGAGKGAFVEVEIPTGAGPEGKKPVKVVVYATKSWDYGIVRFTVNGGPGKDVDLYSGAHGRAAPSGPVELGVFEPRDGKLVLRAEVIGANEKSESTKSFFGLDCVVLTPADGPAK